jgi:predicted Na+-dependent transporter
MEVGKSRWIVLRSISKAAIFFIVFAVGIPLVFGALAGLSSAQILTLITSTFLLQAASPPVGLAMGLSTPAILIILACFAIGIVLAILEICDSLAASSVRVRKWVDNIEEKTRKYPQIQKYGPVTCIGIAWIPGVGLYGTPIIAWILKWKRTPAVFFTVCGFVIAAFFVLFFASRIQQVLQFAGNFGVILLAVVSMLSLGFSINAGRIPDLLRDRRLVILSVGANFIVMPIVGIVLARMLDFPDGIAPGFILIGCAAGSSVLPRLAEISKANIPLAKGLALLLTLISIFFIPLLYPYISPGISANAGILLLILAVCILIPLLSGLYIQRKRPVFADRWSPRMNKISVIVMIVVIIAFWALYVNDIVISAVSGEFVIIALAILVFLLIALGVGYLLAGKDRNSRIVTALGTAERNIAAAALVAAFGIGNHAILLLVLLTGLIGLILFHYVSKWLGKEKRNEPAGTTSS